jgi:Holliday junction resolvase
MAERKIRKGENFEEIFKKILEDKGFIKIRRAGALDFEAEKNGKKYSIEVKGTEQSEKYMMRGPSWMQIKEFHKAKKRGNRVWLVFVHGCYKEYSIFEMVDFNRLPVMSKTKAKFMPEK